MPKTLSILTVIIYYNLKDVNITWDTYLENVLAVDDKLYPEVLFNNVPTRAAWLNSEIFEYILCRDDAFTVAKSTKCPTDWEKAKKLRNKRVDLCNNAKNEYVYTK